MRESSVPGTFISRPNCSPGKEGRQAWGDCRPRVRAGLQAVLSSFCRGQRGAVRSSPSVLMFRGQAREEGGICMVRLGVG